MVTINGLDLSTLGITLAVPVGHDAGIAREWTQIDRMDDWGVIASALRVQGRELVLDCSIKAASRSAMITALQKLDHVLVKQHPCTIVFAVNTSIRAVATYRMRTTEVQPRGWQVKPWRLFSLHFLMASPYFDDAAETSTPGITTTLTNIPAGNVGPMPLEIEIAGPATNPVVTLYNSASVQVASIGLTTSLAGSGNKRIINTSILHTVVDESGVNRINDWTSGQFFQIEPEYYDFATSAWAKIALNSGGGTATVRRRRLWSIV